MGVPNNGTNDGSKERVRRERERGERRREKGEGRREKGEGRREKGEGRREKEEGRREKGEGRRVLPRVIFSTETNFTRVAPTETKKNNNQ